MASPIKLTAADLQGAEDLAPAPIKLTAADLEGATPLDGPQAPTEGRSFLGRAWDSVKGGAHAVATVGSDLAQHPLDTLANPSKRHELERGVADMVTLGYGTKLAARIGNALGDDKNSLDETKHFSASPTAGDTSAPSEREAADAAAAPGYRTAGQIAGMMMPGGTSFLAKGAGRAIAPITKATKVLERIPVAGAALAGATKGLAEYGAAAPAIAALGADADGHRVEAAKTAAMDPAGIVMSGVLGAAVPAARSVGQLVTRVTDKAAELEQTELMRGVAAGEGTRGRATVKAAKLLAKSEPVAVEILRNDKELRDASPKPAKEALPVFHERMDQVGALLDPLYEIKDKATGGVSLINLTNALNDEIATLKKTPLNEQYVRAAEDIRDSALTAWAPEMMDKLKAQGRLEKMGLKQWKEVDDVMVPTKDVRAMVTRLQKRGSQVINPLNPGEASQMKADMASMMWRFLDADLDMAAERSPAAAKAVAEIRRINPIYSAIARMSEAIEQRGWKEATGSVSGAGHIGNLLKHGGAVGGGAMLLHGNIPGAIVATVGPHMLPMAVRAGRGAIKTTAAMSRSPAYVAAISRLAQLARATNRLSDFVRQATAAGMGAVDAQHIWQAAHQHESTR